MIIIILGPPGSGKSTQAKNLASKLGLPAISMGQVLRDAKEAKTVIGLEAAKYAEDGELVPSKIMEVLTRFRLEEKDCESGFILDGAPRRVEEAVVLNNYLSKNKKKIDKVYLVSVSKDNIIDRLLKRVVLPKDKGGARVDDNMQDIKVRIREYEDNIEPLKLYYEGLSVLKEIDGNGTVEEIALTLERDLQI
ncbi:MAG: nucleoside monophosphate kinase [Patescibacteria group bacterium]|nr:nucleoside monophosphate kinase [Patescibacteria group bacterium]